MHKSSRAGPLPSDWQIWCNHLHTIIGRVRFLPLSWGELSFSRELDRNHPYHHREHCLFGRKGMASGQKKTPQAKPEAIVLCTTRLCDCYHMDTSTRGVTPPEGSSQEEHGEVQSSLCAGPVSLGRHPPAHPSPGITAAWGSLRSVQNRNRNCRAVLTARTYLFACTLLWACITNSCSLPHGKTGDCSTK